MTFSIKLSSCKMHGEGISTATQGVGGEEAILGRVTIGQSAPAPARRDSGRSQGHRVVNRARHLLGSVHGGSGPGARQTFMRDADVASNYASRPLSIGHGQTISQPYIVALMMEILDLRRDDWVLEIGTRSGCQTAFLNELVGRVFSIEVVETLAAAARRCLQDLGAIPSRCAPKTAMRAGPRGRPSMPLSTPPRPSTSPRL